MDYEKKYNEALERAKGLLEIVEEDKVEITKDDVKSLFPELAESEDERVIRTLYYLVKDHDWLNGATKGEVLAWLEKQKENPKNDISIPEDCASNAKCPYKIHGDEDFIGDIKDTPAYHFGFDEGVRSEREKQKEQKPTEKQDYSGLNDLERAILRGFLVAGVENVPVTIIKETAQDCLAHMPAWSEADEKKIHFLSRLIEFQVKDGEYCFGEGACAISKQEAIEMLQSLRPSWKPSEELLDALYIVANLPELEFYGGIKYKIRELYKQLKKL